jgi:choline dehydrogenase-like flavoprotein
VSATGEAHEVPGLFVADPSAFPTAVSVDPSETIAAFAFVVADGMLRRGVV